MQCLFRALSLARVFSLSFAVASQRKMWKGRPSDKDNTTHRACPKSSSPEAVYIFCFGRAGGPIRKWSRRGVEYNWTPGLIPGSFGTVFSSRTRYVLGPSLAGKRPTINAR